MSKNIVCIFFISLFFYNFQCNDCENEHHDKSSFTANIFPLKDIYNIGDTILLGTIFNSLVNLENSNTTYDNSNQNVSFVVQVFEVNPNNEVIIDGIEDFEISNRIGQIVYSPYYERRLAKEITNVCDDDNCEFLIEIIPKRKGIYCFSLLNSPFGEKECQYFDLINNDFGLNDNNFKVCAEINTTQFRLLESGAGGTYYSNPEEISRFYFFKVN